MTYIAHLDLAVNQSLRGDRWQSLAAELGAPLRDYSGRTGDIASIVEFVRDAAAMVLPYECFLHTPELVSEIHRSLASGKRLVVQINPNALGQLNPFLDRYGLQGTRVALHDPKAVNHPRLVELSRAVSPRSFAPHQLLDGVDDIVLQQPNAVRYNGSTIPIVALPVDRMLAVDQATDFPLDWTSPDLSSIVLAPVSSHGGILAVSCGFAHDAYTGPTGVRFPGIKGANNERLAANTLRWLVGEGDGGSSLSADAFVLVDQLERCLVDFAVSGLKRGHADWWTDGVPVAVRKICAERAEEEGNRIPKGAYLDLLHVKVIYEANWGLFERPFAAEGWEGGKKRSLGWLVDLNDIRKNVMHPTRRHFQPSLVTAATVAQLREWLARVSRLRFDPGVIH